MFSFKNNEFLYTSDPLQFILPHNDIRLQDRSLKIAIHSASMK